MADLRIKIVKTFCISNDDLYFPLCRPSDVGVETGPRAILGSGLDVDVGPGVFIQTIQKGLIITSNETIRIFDKPVSVCLNSFYPVSNLNIVNRASTERYRNSAIPFLQRKLNESIKLERKQRKALLQVNCVSYVGSITS